MSSKSKDKDPKAKENCVTFEPQAWRRHVCKNCFRTRDAHGQKEANGAAIKPKGNGTVSSIAAKLASSTSPTTSPKQDHKSKGSASKKEDACKSPPPSKKKGGILSKLKKGSGDDEASNGSKNGKTGDSKVKKKTGDLVGSPEIAKKSPTSTVSPPTSKKSPISPTAKKTRAFSPPARKSPSPLSPPTGKKVLKTEKTDKTKSKKNAKDNPEKKEGLLGSKKQNKTSKAQAKKGKVDDRAAKSDATKDSDKLVETNVKIESGDGGEKGAEAGAKINPDLFAEPVPEVDKTSGTDDDSPRGQGKPAEIQVCEPPTPTTDSLTVDDTTVNTPAPSDNQSSALLVQPSQAAVGQGGDPAITNSDENKAAKGGIGQIDMMGGDSLGEMKEAVECTATGEPLGLEMIQQRSDSLASPSEVNPSREASGEQPSSSAPLLPPGEPLREQPEEQLPSGPDNNPIEVPASAPGGVGVNVADGEDEQSLSREEKQKADGASGEQSNTTSANFVLDPCLGVISTEGVFVGGIKAEGEEQVQGVEGQVESGEKDARTLTQGGDSHQTESSHEGGQGDFTVTFSDPSLLPPSVCDGLAGTSTDTESQEKTTIKTAPQSPTHSSPTFTLADAKSSADQVQETSSSSLGIVTVPETKITEDLLAKGETFTQKQDQLQPTPETFPPTNEDQVKTTSQVLEEAKREASLQQQESIVSEQASVGGEKTPLSEGKQNTITDPLLQEQTTTEKLFDASEEAGNTRVGETAEGILEESRKSEKTEQEEKHEVVKGETFQEGAVAKQDSGQEADALQTIHSEGLTEGNVDVGSLPLTDTTLGHAVHQDGVATDVVFITGSGISVDGLGDPQTAPRRQSDAILHASSEISIVVESCDLETAEDILYEKGSTGSENGSDISDLPPSQEKPELEDIKEEEKGVIVTEPSQQSHDVLIQEKDGISDTPDLSVQTEANLDLSSAGGEDEVKKSENTDTFPLAEPLPPPPVGVSVVGEEVVTTSERQGAGGAEETPGGGQVPVDRKGEAPEPIQVKGIEAGLIDTSITGEIRQAEFSDIPEEGETGEDSDYNIIVLPAPDIPDEPLQQPGDLLETGLLSPTSTRSLTESPDQWFEAETELPPPPAFSDSQTSKLVVCLSPSPAADSTRAQAEDLVSKVEEKDSENIPYEEKGQYASHAIESSSRPEEPRARAAAGGTTSYPTAPPEFEIQVSSESTSVGEAQVPLSPIQYPQVKSASPIPDIYIEKEELVPIATTSSDSSFIGEVRVLPGVNITAAAASSSQPATSTSATEAPPVAGDVTSGGVFGVGEGVESGLVAGERSRKKEEEEAGGVVVTSSRGNRRRKRRAGRPSHHLPEQDQGQVSTPTTLPGLVIHPAADAAPPASSLPPNTGLPLPGTPRPLEAGSRQRSGEPPAFPESTHSPDSSLNFSDPGEPVVRPSASLPQLKTQEESTGSPRPGQQTQEEVVACGPVVASTFSRVSSPSSELQVAAATLSLRTPPASPSASPGSLSPAASPTRSRSPQEAAPTSTDDPTTSQGQTCVSKVTSFVISSPEPPPVTYDSVAASARDFDQRTFVFNNINFQSLDANYGGSPVHQEDITTLAKVNVKGKGRKQQHSPDNSSDIFHIARHRPTEGGTFESGFDRTLQFTPSTSAARVRRRRMSDAAYVREDTMMEGTRMLIENLREKQHLLEEKCSRLEREKSALNDLLNVKKSDFQRVEEKRNNTISDLEILCSRLEAENNRLAERLKLPDGQRTEIRDQEIELEELRRKLNEAEDVIGQLTEESTSLQTEIKDMHLEMDEMHDQFRDDEALEFRDLQKELEATAKNCRILQFKLRKVERRNEAFQTERLHLEEKIKVLENRWHNNNEQNQIRELEEELRMAKEVSVRLHDELEIVEERRAKFEEELDRVTDLLRDSEKGRSVLQKEFNTTTEELELLRAQKTTDGGDKLEVPSKKPTLGKKGKEGSVEFDVEQLMRDLADSLEREHDVKGQLEHAEEETINLRKKLSDMEDENEVIQIQLQKMSSAKSGKYFQQKSTESSDDQAAEQESHDLRLQLEMAEEETIVLRRKLDDIDVDNELLKKEVRRLQLKLVGKDSKDLKDEEQEDTRSYDERISAMAQDIDDLKWKLIEKDQERPLKDDKDAENEAERTRVGDQRGMLKKSASLDSHDSHSDMRRQLEVVIQDTAVFKDKISLLEKEKEAIEFRNHELEESLKSTKIPAITADDAAMKNIELQDKIKKLEADNQTLRDTIKRLDDRTTTLSKEVGQMIQGGESAETKEQLRRLEADVSSFQKTISELQDSNKQLANDLKNHESTDEGKKSRAHNTSVAGAASNGQLVEIIKDLESESIHLKTQIKNREKENERLEKEVNEYREDMDKMLDTFKEREADLQMELQTWESKNQVLSNLLELVTERAESIKSMKSEKSDRSLSTVSDVTIGSDDVFGEKLDDVQDWNEKLICRIHSLETLLKEERAKVQSVEKRLLLKDGQQAALTDDMKIHEREKEILLQEQKIKEILEKEKLVIEEELTLCQRQLSDSTDQSKSLREKLDKMQEVQGTLRQDLVKATAELKEEAKKNKDYIKEIATKDAELVKKAEEEKKRGSSKDAKFVGIGGIKEREPASWRWEKQEMERNVKDLKKKVDDLHRQLSRQQVRVKLAGDDQKPRLSRQESVEADQNKTKELEAEIKTLKEDASTRKSDIDKMEAHIKTIKSTLEFREEQWGAERELLNTDRLSVIKESSQKDEIIRGKDEIIKQKSGLIQQRDAALKDREMSMLNYDQTLKEKDEAFEHIQVKLNEVKEELSKVREELKSKEDMLKDMETKVKELNANVSARDGRIKEKDDIIENLNRTLSERESSISSMEDTIQKATKSNEDKASEIKTLREDKEQLSADLTNTTTDLSNAKYKCDDFERKLHSAEKEHGKEIASLVILREKMEAHISQLKTEKSLSDGELQDLKRVMMEKEDFFRQCRNELEVELRTVKEKLHSLEGARLGSQGDRLTKLQLENEDLVNEKNILVKEVKRLAREIENAEADWHKEKKTYRKLMKEKDENLQDLRTKDPDIDDSSLMESGDGARGASGLSQTDIIQKADTSGMEDLYESKLRISQMQIKQVQDEVDELKKDNAQLRDLLMNSQKNLADIKHRHDVNASTWHDERAMLERRTLEADESRRQLDALQRVLQELESQVRRMEGERSELEVQMKEAMAERDAARQKLQAQLNKLEEQSAMTSSGKFKWSERQKRESAWDKERSDHQRALTEYQNLVRDLEAKLKTAQRTRDSDYKDLVSKLENAKKNWDRESNDLRKKSTENEEKAKQVGGLQQTLIDLQYKLQSDREAWLRERSELQRQLRESEKSKLVEKERTTELLSEIRKVRGLTPLQGRAEGIELEIKRKSDAPTSLDLTPSQKSSRAFGSTPTDGSEPVRTIPIRRLDDDPYDKPLLEALRHISQLAENLSKTDIKREDRPKAPPAFRRSLSTSEVEDYRDYIELAEQEETLCNTPAQELSDYHIVSAKPPPPPTPIQETPHHEQVNHRSRSSFRRVHSVQIPDVQITSTTSRLSRPGSARSSMYASGTQSAYSSRDASPERRHGVRKITPYPVAPPSFLITPSRTPRRVTASADREIAMPERHLQKLYEKLSAIEQEQTDQEENMADRMKREGSIEAIEDRQQRGMRLLVKSMSVDSYRDDPNWMPPDAERNHPNAHFCPKQLDTVYDDAPKSQTLPASIRVGEMTIIPGQSELAQTSHEVSNTPAVRRQAERARKQFYENYPPEKQAYFSWPRKSRRDKHEDLTRTLADVDIKPETATVAPIPAKQDQDGKQVVIPIGKHRKEKDKGKHKEEEKKESRLSYFFSSVKDRRKLFSKKSRSVDESPIRKSVMQAGLQAGRAAAPSTFETPEKAKEPKETKEPTSRSSTLRERFHKRAASLDVSSLFSVSSSSHSSKGGDPGAAGRRSSIGTSGASSVVSEPQEGTSGSGKKDHSRDGTCRDTDPEVCTETSPLTKLQRPKTPINQAQTKRWRTPSMEKAKQRPIFLHNSDTDRFEIVVKRRSLSESNVVFLEHMHESQTWNFTETRV